MSNIKNQIRQILSDFGMKGTKAAEVMGISHAVFRNRMSDKNTDTEFNQENLNDLKSFILKASKNLT